MFIHNISRVALEVGPLQIRWYGIMFALGVMGYYLLTRWLWQREADFASKAPHGKDKRHEKWPIEDFDSLILFLFVGLVTGARLGEVFFYNFAYYSNAGFWEIFKVWHGGLSSHGAAIGLLIAYTCFWLWKRRKDPGLRFFQYIDLIAVCMPLVAGFVRIGNFFNSEIVGRVSDVPWAVVFAQNGEVIARHPAQLYEGLWAWVVFGIVFGLWQFSRNKRARGWVRGWVRGWAVFSFVGLYFLGRFLIEFFKEYQISVGSDGLPWGLTMGQGLSILPVVMAVIYFGIVYLRNDKKSAGIF